MDRDERRTEGRGSQELTEEQRRRREAARRRREAQGDGEGPERRENQTEGRTQRRRSESDDGIRRSPEGRHSSDSRRRKKKKQSASNAISTAVLVVAVAVFVFSLFQLITMIIPYYSGGKEYDKIKNLAIEVREPEDDTEEEEKKPIFRINFNALLEENADTVAWIRFEEPSIISYPVVKSADNKEYLTKTFTTHDNKLGAIFMDMRCNSAFTDKNTIIYGHNLKVGGEMFSQLKEYQSEAFCKEHPYFWIYTPDGKVRTYTIFSAGVVKDTAGNYNMNFGSDSEFEEYIELCRASSRYNVDVDINAQSHVVSLSTCTNVREDERFLVQGVMTSEEMVPME